jgi:hypothetical protein
LAGHNVTIEYKSQKSGIHAYDSLATWKFTQSQADRCQQLSGAECVAGNASTFPIPLDLTVAGHQLTGQVFTIYRSHHNRNSRTDRGPESQMKA